MINYFKKLFFSITKPNVVVVAGLNRAIASDAIAKVLGNRSKQVKKIPFCFSKNSIFIFQAADRQEIERLEYVLNNSCLPILALTSAEHVGGNLPASLRLVSNVDDMDARNKRSNMLTFGLSNKADFRASDIKDGMNFKINYKGSFVPVWLKGVKGKEYVYAALSAICVGSIFGINLVDASQRLKN